MQSLVDISFCVVIDCLFTVCKIRQVRLCLRRMYRAELKVRRNVGKKKKNEGDCYEPMIFEMTV